MESLKNINSLPYEVIINIFEYLSLEDLLECENVCQMWKNLARDPSLWRRILIVYSDKPGKTESGKKILETIKTHSEFVQNIKLQYVFSYAVIKTALCNCENLISIELVMCRITREFEKDLLQWPRLKKLNLKNSLTRMIEELPIQYDNFKDLNYLALSDFGLYQSNCETLLRCNNLSHILIDKIRNLSLEFIKTLIKCKQNMITLHIYGGNSVDDECLYYLSQCTMLNDFAILRCDNLSDQGLLNLIHLKKLKHLQLWYNLNFTEINLLKTLTSTALVSLQSLSFSHIFNISPMIVDLISEHYKHLKFLSIYRCPQIMYSDYEKQLHSKFRNINVVL